MHFFWEIRVVDVLCSVLSSPTVLYFRGYVFGQRSSWFLSIWSQNFHTEPVLAAGVRRLRLIVSGCLKNIWCKMCGTELGDNSVLTAL